MTALKLPSLPFALEPEGSPPPGCRIRSGVLTLTAAANTDLFVDPAGVEVLHAPREWPEYHPGYYAVFLRDPDGHNVEAVHHG